MALDKAVNGLSSVLLYSWPTSKHTLVALTQSPDSLFRSFIVCRDNERIFAEFARKTHYIDLVHSEKFHVLCINYNAQCMVPQPRYLVRSVVIASVAVLQVLIPVFALGRAQELCILLETYWQRMNLGVPIYFSLGLTEKVLVRARARMRQRAGMRLVLLKADIEL